MRLEKELILFQVSTYSTDATEINAGLIVMLLIKCGVGQTKNQVLAQNHVLVMINAMDIITNAHHHVAYDSE
jgi:hypothetical protein